MTEKKKVYAYFDGSNFYHNLKSNYGITSIRFDDICNRMLELSKEELVKIRYFNCPINQQEDPQKYAKQLKFFENLISIIPPVYDWWNTILRTYSLKNHLSITHHIKWRL